MPKIKVWPVYHNGLYYGSVIDMDGAGGTKLLAVLPDGQSVGQKSHKAFSTPDAAESWLRHHAIGQPKETLNREQLPPTD